MATRRSVILGGLALAGSACVPVEAGTASRLEAKLRILEAETGGELGVFALDTRTGLGFGHRQTERFGHCSSFKASLAAMVLQLDADGTISADEHVRWTREQLMSVSPFTTRRLEEGASLRELAEFTQKYSDNAAANILLAKLGGPQALTAFWRSMGDEISRLDRTEPELNQVPRGELRDTTTPRAMATTLARMLYGGGLAAEASEQLMLWMHDTPTGLRRVRAGLPEGWRAGDKTGTSTWPGMRSLYVDIGFIEPPGRAPLTFATYYRAPAAHDGMDAASEAVLAQAGVIIARWAAA
ncbi:MAG: class A beta-lactamase [Alphaproteobacteria bacterium]|nr:class A beta-lactamase [Alphaproteobacteria bacterium]